jgi:hypothetical protein
MKGLFTAMAVVVFASATIPYFKYLRDVQGGGNGHQQYVAIDETVWPHARPDLADLRLYAGQNEVPYFLSTERGSLQTEQKQVRILQPGTVNGKTQFFLDMSGLAEYDRIAVALKTINFVAKARVEGADDLHNGNWATLANSIIYDLSDDRLGGNTTLRLPLTTYKYLRVTLDGPVKPSDIESATANVRDEEKEVWRAIRSQATQQQQGKDTVFIFTVPKNVPVERLAFTIDPAQPNFQRQVELQRDKDIPFSSGEISRVHMVRHGQKIDSEQTNLDLAGTSPQVLKVIVHNGDDPPLKINQVRLQQYARRIYFNSSSAPHLYYGDEKLEAPEYDYAKLFQKEPNPTQAELGPEQMNSAYTGRPDERPWSDRHPAVLWVAIIAAVLTLGAVALRSMKAAAAASSSGQAS